MVVQLAVLSLEVRGSYLVTGSYYQNEMYTVLPTMKSQY